MRARWCFTNKTKWKRKLYLKLRKCLKTQFQEHHYEISQAKVYFKKTIYKYFANKELLIEESVQVIHNEINNIITQLPHKILML
jgi:hypothetical protein